MALEGESCVELLPAVEGHSQQSLEEGGMG